MVSKQATRIDVRSEMTNDLFHTTLDPVLGLIPWSRRVPLLTGLRQTLSGNEWCLNSKNEVR